MEYTFRRNLYGEAEAELSSEQQTFGLWLSEDMLMPSRVTELLEQLTHLLNNSAQPFQFESSHYILEVDRSSVELHAKQSDEVNITNEMTEYDNDFQLCEDNHYAHCGPEDFYALLSSWAHYI